MSSPTEFRMFTLERTAHLDNSISAAIAPHLPFVLWVNPKPVASLHFPCDQPVYVVHPESIGQLFRAAGIESRIPKYDEHAVCGCMGKLVEQ